MPVVKAEVDTLPLVVFFNELEKSDAAVDSFVKEASCTCNPVVPDAGLALTLASSSE